MIKSEFTKTFNEGQESELLDPNYKFIEITMSKGMD